ncbi:MAG: hypothetical protein JWO09_2100 [Bacteroidetes bacterium]|nr:hypothetical protein [Bacteroidota bacterium]
MIVLWGKKTKILETYQDEDTICENCSSNSVSYFVYQDYYHIFFIPLFPILKYGGMYCSNCDNSHIHTINSKLSEYERRTRTPISMYSFPIIILIIIILNLLGVS